MKVKELIWNLEDDATDLDKLLGDIEEMEDSPKKRVALQMWKEAFESWKETVKGLGEVMARLEGENDQAHNLNVD